MKPLSAGILGLAALFGFAKSTSSVTMTLRLGHLDQFYFKLLLGFHGLSYTSPPADSVHDSYCASYI